ncbi:S49 family peptidase [Actibacterium sp. MT2.3-13A]|uniref:S49 family peptidase n=1 Tax=Actibacterium sp. MT2.3-13A TaxID=2828332 RepID=UPI001BAD2A89|nr:S49 family peptidase [Actibacterium sp. MT2.3-13A]
MKRWIPFLTPEPLVAVLRLNGMIAADARGRVVLNDAGLAPLIEKAFSRGKPAAVALALNSPGGSPAQSSMIFTRIRRLAAEKGVPVYAFVEDVAASGGYYIACAADEIWVDDNSIVGSIGVVSAGFGFHDFIARHGVERRLYTAGRSKSLLDPFQPEKPEDVARLKSLQEAIHQSFIDRVKARRAGKLHGGADLFAGDVWVGGQAVELGLADGVGHLVPVMKERFGDKVKFRDYGPRRSVWQRFGAQVLGGLAGELEERALWARFGL